MSIPKPKHCRQEWLDMKPVTGGRLCGQCSKTIVDFSNRSWSEIEEMQAQAGNALCGMYSDRQLKHWGQQPPARRNRLKPVLAASSIVVALNAVPAATTAQTVVPVEVLDSLAREGVDPMPTVGNGVVVFQGQVTLEEDNGWIEPGSFVNVYLSPGMVGAATDEDGNYRFEWTKGIDALQGQQLIFSYPGFGTVRLNMDGIQPGANRIDQTLRATESEIIAFYVREPKLHKRVLSKVRAYALWPYYKIRRW